MLNYGITVPFWTKQTQRTIVMCAIDWSLIGMIAMVAIKSHTRELEIVQSQTYSNTPKVHDYLRF